MVFFIKIKGKSMKIKGNKNIKLLLEFLLITIGTALMAIGVSVFLLSNKLSSGGFSGIATILYYILDFPMGITIIVLNIPLYIISFFKLGKKFIFKAFLGMIFLSIFIDLFEKIPLITHDRFLASIYGGIFVGIGTALVLKAEASTGGSELLSIIIQKNNPGAKISSFLVIIDILIVLANVIFLKQIEIGLYSAVAIFISGKMVDIIFEGIYYTKLLIIISDKSEEIAKEIADKVERGITGLNGKGMYTNNEKLVLMCAVSRRDIGEVKKIIKEIDKKSFVIVTDAREVLGKGFKT